MKDAEGNDVRPGDRVEWTAEIAIGDAIRHQVLQSVVVGYGEFKGTRPAKIHLATLVVHQVGDSLLPTIEYMTRPCADGKFRRVYLSGVVGVVPPKS